MFHEAFTEGSKRPLALLAALCLFVPALAAGQAPRLVKDINRLARSGDSFPDDYVRIGGLVFFTADDGVNGRELWRTDGTAGGTYPLTDACPGACSSNPRVFSINDGKYFFLAFDGTRYNLWVSGGTPATTLELLREGSGSFSSYGGRRWVPALGLLLFTWDDGTHGPELWRSDGSPGGTYPVIDLWPGRQESNPHPSCFPGRPDRRRRSWNRGGPD